MIAVSTAVQLGHSLLCLCYCNSTLLTPVAGVQHMDVGGWME